MPVRRLSQPYPFTLSIEGLELPVHLGVTAEEQATAQVVTLSATLYYPTTPDATQQDSAAYQCYDHLCRLLRQTAAEHPVALIEYLLGALYRTLRAEVPDEVKIRLRLHKPLPESLVGYAVQGATAEYTDLLEGLA